MQGYTTGKQSEGSYIGVHDVGKGLGEGYTTDTQSWGAQEYTMDSCSVQRGGVAKGKVVSKQLAVHPGSCMGVSALKDSVSKLCAICDLLLAVRFGPTKRDDGLQRCTVGAFVRVFWV